jgi:hypothetical protein
VAPSRRNGALRWRLHHAEFKAAADRTEYSRICKRANDLTDQIWRLADAILEMRPTTKARVSVQAAALAKDESFDFIENELMLPSLVLRQIASAGGFPEVGEISVEQGLGGLGSVSV